jgi:hypothetical protein
VSLIDKTYFVGELDIPNWSNANVAARLQLFIDKYEARFLKQLLGNDLYTDFIAGIQEDPMDELWSNLLYGAGLWSGLVQMDSSLAASVLAAGNTAVVVGRGQAYDPAPDTSTTTIPPAYVGRTFRFLQRGFGQYRSDELTIAGDQLTLPAGFIFSDGDTYFYDAPYSLSLTGESTSKQSLIANYVYYWWMRDSATKTMGVGEGQPQLENATRTNNAQKMARAWNEMADGVRTLYEWLDENKTLYPNWPAYNYGTTWRPGFGWRHNDLLSPINTFNL